MAPSLLDRGSKLVCFCILVCALDLVGPHPFFAELSNTKVHLLWKDLNPVACSLGYSIVPTTSIKDCARHLDVLFVPGGPASTDCYGNDGEILSFVAHRGSRARYVTSVSTGSSATTTADGLSQTLNIVRATFTAALEARAIAWCHSPLH